MRSPVLALWWYVVRPHQAGLVLCALTWLVMAVLCRLVPPALQPAGVWVWGLAVTVPSVMVLLYVLYVFSLGTTTPLPDQRESTFPRGLLLLPLSTRELVGWLMVPGSVVMMVLWFGWATAILWPCGVAAHLFAPALFAAAFLAWLQVIAWSPFPISFLRGWAAGVLLSAIVGLSFIDVSLNWPPGVGAAVAAALVATGYGLALRGVSRARCAEGKDWPWFNRVVQRLDALLPRRGQAFAAARQAQTWLERRQRGLLVLFLFGFFVLVVVVFATAQVLTGNMRNLNMLGVLWPQFREFIGPAFGVWILLTLLLATPLVMATALGLELGTSRLTGPAGARTEGMSSFLALRPFSTNAFVAAKLRLAAWITWESWALVLVGATFWLLVTGCYRDLLAAPFLQSWTGWQIALGTLLWLALLVLLTWLQLVGGLWVGLTGRNWVAMTVVVTGMTLMLGLGFGGHWLGGHPEYQPLFWDFLPWLGGGLVLLKLGLAVWLARALRHQDLLSRQTLCYWAVGWLLAVGGVGLLLHHFLTADLLPWYGSALAAALLVPLVRFAAAPVALAWNRHR